MEHLNCKNCGFGYTGHFCPQCGQPAHEKRIDAQWLLHDVPHSVFHIDKGFFYTVSSLFTNPGQMVENYLQGKRVKYFRPFAYVVLMSTICALITKGLQALTQNIYLRKNVVAVAARHESFLSHYFSVFIFIMIPLASLITWLAFVKRKYNYWEHFLINTYIAAQLNLLLVLVSFIAFITALFSDAPPEANFSVVTTVFMTGFLFLYGYTFGGLMHQKGKALSLILILTAMNSLLFVVYYAGLVFAGIAP